MSMSTTLPISSIENQLSRQKLGHANETVPCSTCDVKHKTDFPVAYTVYGKASADELDKDNDAAPRYRITAAFCPECDIRTFRELVKLADPEQTDNPVRELRDDDADEVLFSARILEGRVSNPRIIERRGPGESSAPVAWIPDEYANGSE